MNNRVAVYARVSSRDQIDNYSIPAQLRACRERALRDGSVIVGEYLDEGRSARSEQIARRPEFARLLTDAEHGNFDVLLVHKLDRLSRNLRVTLHVYSLLAKANVGLVSVTEQLDYTTPQGKLMLNIQGALAEFYSDNLSQETKKGKRERKAQGIYNGYLPFGMRKGGTGLPEADPQTLPGVLLAFQAAAEGKSDREVAETLNAAGYRTTGNRGANPWTKDSVRELLTNRFYLGELPDRDGWLLGKHAAVLPETLWSAAQAARLSHVRAPNRTTRIGRTLPFSALARCAHCGGHMRANYSQRASTTYLRCATRIERGICSQPHVRSEAIEQQLVAYLSAFRIPPAEQKHLLSVLAAGVPRQTDAGEQRRRLEARLERLGERYELGDITRERYLAQRQSLQQEIESLAPPVGAGDADLTIRRLGVYLQNVTMAWIDASLEQRNRLARALFEQVWIMDHSLVAVQPRPELRPLFGSDYAPPDASTSGVLMRNRRDSNPRSRH